MWKKLSDTLYDMTLGLAKKYQEKALDIAKIQAATMYIKAIKAVREHVVSLVVLIFSLMVLAFGIILIPLAIVVSMEWIIYYKILVICLLGLIYILVPLVVINRYLSEKAWMKMSKSDELIQKILQ